MRTLALLLAWSCCGAACAAPPDVPRQLKACGDINEFPPYTFFERQAGRMTPAVAGSGGLSVGWRDERQARE